jgi:DNA polymerase-1
MAHYAKDKAMIDSFKENKDFHTSTAALVFNVPEKDVTRQQRAAAKAVNFGINYGLSPHGLERQTDMNFGEAKDFIDKYFGVYKGLADYMKKTVAEAREKGYAETLFGRKRYLPDINSNNFMVRSGAERMALNMPIQGTAADMIKLAMIEIHKDFAKICPEAKLMLQVHDELVFEVPNDSVEKMSRFIHEKMENVVNLDVPILVNIGVGKNWGESK